MIVNNVSLVAISPTDIDTFIALNIPHGQRWGETNLSQSPSVIGLSKDLSVLDINKTLSSLSLALSVVFSSISEGNKVLFVRSHTMSSEVVSKFVSKANQVFVLKPFGGVLSNWLTFSHAFCRIKQLAVRVRQLRNRKLKRVLVRRISKWTKHFIGFNQPGVLPKAVIVSCDEQVKPIIKEANGLKIPVIGFVDALSIFRGVDFVVPVCSSSRSAVSFIYRMVCVTCSLANMSYDRKVISSLIGKRLSLSGNCDFHSNLIYSCLHFKNTITDSFQLQYTYGRRKRLLIFNMIRNLDLKLVCHWVLSNAFLPSTLIKTIVRYVTISQLRMIGNGTNLSCFTRKLIVNFQMIWTLTKLTKFRGFVQDRTETAGFAIPRNAYFTTKPKFNC